MTNAAHENPALILMAGPTAVGKSEIALPLAERLNGEIVSVDSMQVYRGMDIGTAKPTIEELRRVRHHLIDVVDLTEPFDAAQFVRLANTAVEEIRSRKRVPILCGGTGFYFKALLDGLGQAPPTDSVLRAELEATPIGVLLDELAQKDPITYERIDRQNARRVVRAVEVMRLTGKPFSEQRANWGAVTERSDSATNANQQKKFFIGLKCSSSDLQRRINARVDEMFKRGLVDETQELLKQGLAENRTAMQALGYRQVVEHLQGMRSLPETIELIKIRTRQFAKRQLTWFKKYGPTNWINLSLQQTPESSVNEIITSLRNSDCMKGSP